MAVTAHELDVDRERAHEGIVVKQEPERRGTRAREPMLVPGIYEYCLRRCARCQFTSRCLLYRESAEEAYGRGADLRHRNAADDDAEHGGAADLRRTIDLVRAACHAIGVDSDDMFGESISDIRTESMPDIGAESVLDICGESTSEADVAAEERLDAARAAAHCDPLSVAAQEYECAAYEVVDPLRQLSPFHDWPPDVEEALDTISWNAGAIRAKLYRALAGRAEREAATGAGQARREGKTSAGPAEREEETGAHQTDRASAARAGRTEREGGADANWNADEDRDDDEHSGSDDPVQNDWNGSAKVARLAIAESIAAWDVLFVAGETPYDAPIRQRRRELERMDDEIARRFPHAMSFVRPGFDEPEVNACGLRSAESLHPRRRLTIMDKLARWWSRCFGR